MKQVIHVTVDVPDCLKNGEFKTVFHHAMTVDDSLKFDYTHVLIGLHCLFLDGIITFKVM